MMMRIGMLIAALALAFGLPTASARAETMGSPGGGVYLSTLPVGADVWIDGVYVGRSPVLVDALAVGRHTVTATKTGWESREIDVSIAAGAMSMAALELAHSSAKRPPGAGKLALFSAGEVRELTIDGTPVSIDKAGSLVLPAGPHLLAVRTTSGSLTRHVTIYPDTTTDVIVRESAVEGGPHVNVVAPADEYLPQGSYQFGKTNVYVKYRGHEVIAHIGESNVRLDGVAVTFDAAPAFIAGKLYLPLALLKRITAEALKAPK